MSQHYPVFSDSRKAAKQWLFELAASKLRRAKKPLSCGCYRSGIRMGNATDEDPHKPYCRNCNQEVTFDAE